MAELLTGPAVGVSLAQTVNCALQIITKGRKFRQTLKTNIETLDALAPLVEEMKGFNDLLDRPSEEIERLEKHMREGKEIVEKSKKFTWRKFFSFPGQQVKLKKQDDKLKRDLSVIVQAQNKRDLMEVLTKVNGIFEFLMKNLGQFDGIQIRGLRGAPDEPQCIGMVEPLKKLKSEMMKDSVSVLVLTGLGGSGKTTLAKKFCWDKQIKGKFGKNIFFFTVSKTPNWKIIAQTLFEYCGGQVPEFSNDEDAIHRLRILLSVVGRNPILLVLDDVWPGSESLVENFKFEMPDYKILVTSRVAFRRFGTPCKLDPLGHDHAVSLFRHFAQLNESSSYMPDIAQLNESSSYMPDKNLVDKIVKGCKGSPLALQVTAGSLCRQPFEKWQNMKRRLKSQTIFESNSTKLLSRLQQSLDILEDKNEECFLDLGLFPNDQTIPVTVLIDMWATLYNLDEDGTDAMDNVNDLSNVNLINVIATRSDGQRSVVDSVKQQFHHRRGLYLQVLRCLSQRQRDTENRERVRVREWNCVPDSPVKESLYSCPQRWAKGGVDELNGSMSRSTWNACGLLVCRAGASLYWVCPVIRAGVNLGQKVATETDMYYNNHYVMMHDLLRELATHQSKREPFEQRKRLMIDLNGDERPVWWIGPNQQGIISRMYSFITGILVKQKQIKVAARILSISTDESFSSDWCDMQPDEAEVLILNLRSDKYSLPDFTEKMIKLKVLIVINYDALPNLVELSIDYCNDLIKLPDGFCNITTLKKLSITNCHKLSAIPQDIGKLENLELLRLCSCSDLEGMPESVAGLTKLRCLDISDCVNLPKLPDDIGELQKLEKLSMKGCSKLSVLPDSVIYFENLEHEMHVICDEERGTLWERFPNIPKLKIDIPKVEINLNWLHGTRS
ncbi:hypothetical protein TSUD_232780 [Trifolium subterraneum]|uniref:RPW8 domain-containing protein n=1 Tax=Trifolium subterraneum TaxID=3900 RepID=A0A2Z6LN44_TRISU|nr:hypothetical protein TSUD_232780 [Trifolium subterraneum]